MLAPYLTQLNSKRIILASASPRRQEILGKQLGIKYEVVVSNFEELLPKEQYKGPEGAARYAVDTAKGKVVDVCHSFMRGERGPLPLLVIGADTVVEHAGAILEKPDDAKMAYDMLRRLSGGLHHVHTGVVLALWDQPAHADASKANSSTQEPFVHTFSSTTNVVFDELSDDVINAYIASGEPFGKAGSYGIQGTAGGFVKGIEGCFFNVVGFPVHKFASELGQLIQAGKLQLS